MPYVESKMRVHRIVVQTFPQPGTGPALASTVAVKSPAHDRLVHVDVAVPYLQIEAAVGIAAYPCFILNTCALATKIRKRNKVANFAFLAFGEIELVQDSHLPTKNRIFPT